MPLVPLPYRILVEKDEGGQHWLVVLWSVQVRHDPGLTEESSATKTRRVDFHKRLRAHDGNIFIQGGGTVLPALDRDARTANARFDCQATPARAKPAMYAAQRGRRHDGLWNYQEGRKSYASVMADADIQAFIYANQDVAMAADLSAGEGKQTFLEVTTHRMPKSQKILRELAKGFEKGRRATTLMEYLRTKLNDTEKHGFTTDFATGGKNWEWRAAKTLAEGLLIPAAADGLARPFKMEKGILSNLDIRNDTLLDAYILVRPNGHWVTVDLTTAILTLVVGGIVAAVARGPAVVEAGASTATLARSWSTASTVASVSELSQATQVVANAAKGASSVSQAVVAIRAAAATMAAGAAGAAAGVAHLSEHIVAEHAEKQVMAEFVKQLDVAVAKHPNMCFKLAPGDERSVWWPDFFSHPANPLAWLSPSTWGRMITDAAKTVVVETILVIVAVAEHCENPAHGFSISNHGLEVVRGDGTRRPFRE